MQLRIIADRKQLALHCKIFNYTPALKKRGVYCFTSVCPSISPSGRQSVSQSVRPMNIFRRIFLRNYTTRISEIGFRLDISQLYRVMRFQIHHSTTSCLPNTCLILHMIAKLKIFRHIFLRNYNSRISEIWFKG